MTLSRPRSSPRRRAVAPTSMVVETRLTATTWRGSNQDPRGLVPWVNVDWQLRGTRRPLLNVPANQERSPQSDSPTRQARGGLRYGGGRRASLSSQSRFTHEASSWGSGSSLQSDLPTRPARGGLPDHRYAPLLQVAGELLSGRVEDGIQSGLLGASTFSGRSSTKKICSAGYPAWRIAAW